MEERRIARWRELFEDSLDRIPFRQLAAEIGGDRKAFGALLRFALASASDERVSWRALWLAERISREHPEQLAPHIGALSEALAESPHTGTRRLLLTMLSRHRFTQLPVDLLDWCFERIGSSAESPAVRARAARTAYRLCRLCPELFDELQLRLEEADTSAASPAVQAAFRDILRKLCKRERD